MSYYVSGSGVIRLANTDPDKIASLREYVEGMQKDGIFDYVEFDAEAITMDQTRSDVIIVVTIDTWYYEDEEILDFLNEAKPLLLAGSCISCRSEDNLFWRYESDEDGDYHYNEGDVLFEGMSCWISDCAYQNGLCCQCHKVHGRYPEWKETRKGIRKKNCCNEFVRVSRKKRKEKKNVAVL